METVVAFFQDGGAFMYPIGLVLVFGLAISLERIFSLGTLRSRNDKFWREVLPRMQQGQLQQAHSLSQESKSEVARIMDYGLERLKTATRLEEVEMALEEGLMEVLPRLEKRTQYVATLANIATLLGLLGTIIGLIAAFSAVANADPADKANLLSASISTAMNTTAFGLMAAIPLLLFYAYLQSRAQDIGSSLEMIVVKFVNMLPSVEKLAQQKAQAQSQGPAKAKRPTASPTEAGNGSN